MVATMEPAPTLPLIAMTTMVVQTTFVIAVLVAHIHQRIVMTATLAPLMDAPAVNAPILQSIVMMEALAPRMHATAMVSAFTR